MNNNKIYISDIISDKIEINIEIRDKDNNYIGHLDPITISTLENKKIAGSMTKWRKKARDVFLTQFDESPERTKRWLEEVVLKDHSRMLFLIYSPTKLIGQYGFIGLTEESVELDNMIRGEAGGHKKLIYHAEKALITWLIETFRIKMIYGYVLSDNSRVLNLHQSIGFQQTELLPLYKDELQGDVKLKLGTAGEASPFGLYAQKIELLSSDFISQG